MTDALCGPSNALQTFRKHTSVDRTLQQDRLAGPRHSPLQGFRSHDPRAGSLDADFHAFENAPTNPFNVEQPTWNSSSHRSSPQPANSSWASDFQNLHISNAPLPSHQMRMAAPLMTTTNAGWGQEFMQQRQNMTPVQQGKQPEMTSASASMFNSVQNPLFQPTMNQQALYAPSQQNVTQEPQLQDPSFDKAFQDAFDSIQQSELGDMDAEEATILKEPVHDMEYDPALLQPLETKIGSDAIDYTEQKDRTADQDTQDAGDLARVAGQLLQNVSHEQNEKFQNSKFLDLMKKIRDREIEVRNNDFESTYVDHAEPQSALADPEAQKQEPNAFSFPDMNKVYAPDTRIDAPSEYSFDADQFPYQPYNQISDLHPGGPRYPEQSPPQPSHAQMSGAVNTADYVSDGAGTSYATA